MNLEAEFDQLYSLPLAEFVAARNELAKKARAAGDRERADDIKLLAKPNVPAWTVNRLWHRHRKVFDRLLEAGQEMRSSVATGKGGREAAAKRREATRDLLALAKGVLSEAGHPATSTVLQQISHTLDAIAARDVEEMDPPPGRLDRDLDPPGFEFLADLTPASVTKRKARSKNVGKKSPPRKTAPKPRKGTKKGGGGATKAKQRDRRLEAAKKALEESLAALKTAEKKADQLEAELSRAQTRAAKTEEVAHRAAQKARKAAKEAAQAETDEKIASQTARAARTAARQGAAKVRAAEDRLTKLSG